MDIEIVNHRLINKKDYIYKEDLDKMIYFGKI